MNKYYLEYKRKRLLRNFFKMTDVWELYGPKDFYYPDLTHGNGGTSEIRTSTRKLETFLNRDDAYSILNKYNYE